MYVTSGEGYHFLMHHITQDEAILLVLFPDSHTQQNILAISCLPHSWVWITRSVTVCQQTNQLCTFHKQYRGLVTVHRVSGTSGDQRLPWPCINNKKKFFSGQCMGTWNCACKLTSDWWSWGNRKMTPWRVIFFCCGDYEMMTSWWVWGC